MNPKLILSSGDELLAVPEAAICNRCMYEAISMGAHSLSVVYREDRVKAD